MRRGRGKWSYDRQWSFNIPLRQWSFDIPIQPRTLILVLLVIFSIAGLVSYAIIRGLHKPVETSQGVIIRNHISYNNGNLKTMRVGFATPDWYDEADLEVLQADVCEFLLNSDWEGIGVNARNASVVIVEFRGSYDRRGFVAQCDLPD